MLFDFNNLFVLDIANNHQGSVSHGKAIKKLQRLLISKKSRPPLNFSLDN